ncbi:MAG TPA: NAD(P)-dependent oxidoreductase [Solirubrobacteraceae bacterium]|nr:NAD(P)-dependent oxidoreductase [Solirubrobacteraceae bacterium]
MSRVLLTGASGFLGAHALAPLVEAGHEVHALARSRRPDERARPGAAAGPAHSERVIWHVADLTDAAAAEAVVSEIAAEHLLHLAWYVEHGLYWQAPENVVWVEATLRLLRAFATAGGRRAVIAGTCAEYEWSQDEPYDERTAPLAPATMYGVAKHATHLVAERFAASADVELAWGRIFMPYGPGEGGQRLVPSVIRALLAGQEAPVSDGAQARDFMYAEDVARAFAAILDSDARGAINVASGRCCTIREMVTLVAEAAGRPELVRWGAVPTRPGDPSRLTADVRRLREEVGFAPRVELEDGVQRTVAWWREAAL